MRFKRLLTAIAVVIGILVLIHWVNPRNALTSVFLQFIAVNLLDGDVYERWGLSELAENAHLKALDLTEIMYSGYHPEVIDRIIRLANYYGAHGRAGDAKPLIDRAVALLEHNNDLRLFEKYARNFALNGFDAAVSRIERRAQSLRHQAAER